jgi:hypothetical protein
VIEALVLEGIAVTNWGWRYIPQVGETYLLVCTPSISTHGPIAVMKAQKSAFAKANIDPRIISQVRLIRA